MVGLGGLADVELMVFGSDVAEHCRTVVDLAVQQFLEMVTGRDQYFRWFIGIFCVVHGRQFVEFVVVDGLLDVFGFEDLLEVLDVLVDLGFVVDVFGLSGGAVFLLSYCSDDLLQLIQFLLKRLDIILAELNFELLRELLGPFLKPQLI